MQQELGSRRGDPGATLRFRIGIHLGDVMVDGDDLLGEGVILAARLQTMAEPGGILISQQVYDQVHAKLSVGFEYLGVKRPKNFSEDVPVYCVSRGRKKHKTSKEKPRTRQSRPLQMPESETAPPRELLERVTHRGKLFGINWAFLLVVDLITGPGLWAHFPGIVLAGLVLWQAAPLFARGWFSLGMARGAVIAGVLALINLAT